MSAGVTGSKDARGPRGNSPALAGINFDGENLRILRCLYFAATDIQRFWRGPGGTGRAEGKFDFRMLHPFRCEGLSIETADMLVQEVLAQNMRDRRAMARYAGLTGLARRERHKTPGERAGPFRQRFEFGEA
jgi:hypothetical protein